MATTLRRSALQLIKKHKIASTSVTVRHKSSESEEKNLLRSAYKDIQVTNDLISDFVWQNLDRWPDKTATVSAFTVLHTCYMPPSHLSIKGWRHLENVLP